MLDPCEAVDWQKRAPLQNEDILVACRGTKQCDALTNRAHTIVPQASTIPKPSLGALRENLGRVRLWPIANKKRNSRRISLA